MKTASKTKRTKEQRLTVVYAYERELWLEGALRYKGVLVSSMEAAGNDCFDIVAGLTFRRVPGGSIVTYTASKPGKAKYKNKVVYAYAGATDVMHRSKVAAGRWADSGTMRLDLGQLLKFDSQAEYRYWVHLKGLEQSGAIWSLKTQVSFELYPRFEWLGVIYRHIYRADFTYETYLDDDKERVQLVIVDIKGVETELFKLKFALLLSVNYDKFARREWRFDLVQAKDVKRYGR